MTDQIVLSNSAIQTFKHCRRRYWLKYFRRLSPKKDDYVGPLPFGTRVHKALELYYHEVGEGKTSDEADLLGIWSDLTQDDRLLAISSGEFMDNFDKEAELGRVMLEGYLEWIEDEGIDSELEIISQEETLEHEMLDGRVKLVGKIDQRVKRKQDGTRMIRDFKTAASLPELHKTTPQAEQFILYMVLEMLQKDEWDRVSGAIVTALRKSKRSARAKGPFYDQVEVQHNIFTLRNFWRRIQGEVEDVVRFWDRLEAGEDHQVVAYPSPSRDCFWKCEFASVCPLFDDGSDVDRAIEDQFEARSPYEYYGENDPTKT